MARRTRQSIEQGTAAPSSKNKNTPLLTPDRMFIGGSLILTVVIIGVIALNSFQANYTRTVNIEGVQVFAGLAQTHTETAVTYTQLPPAGGPHHPAWQNCGVYNEPLMNEHAVHSLEHGAVWITYQPDLAPDQVQILRDITQRGTHRLLSPYPGMDSPITLSAWGYQLKVSDANDARVMQFINKYEQGPTTPEPGAVCTRGESRTLAQLGG
jgi:hypothetical protein